MTIIDAHVYLGEGIGLKSDTGMLLDLMDKAGVSFAVACPVDRYTAVANRDGNDMIAGEVKNHPDRLAGLAVANPWFGADSVDEIRRALDLGLAGIKIHSPLQGFRLSDHLVDPLLEAAADYRVPVYAHTGTAGIAEPFHCVELARRFPSIQFVMVHGGASDYYNDTVRALEFADNLWVESSRNGPANFCHWQVNGIVDRVLFGSSCPEYIPALEIDNLCDVFVDDAARRRMFSESVIEVFKGRIG